MKEARDVLFPLYVTRLCLILLLYIYKLRRKNVELVA
jgi:hypothetical protein